MLRRWFLNSKSSNGKLDGHSSGQYHKPGWSFVQALVVPLTLPLIRSDPYHRCTPSDPMSKRIKGCRIKTCRRKQQTREQQGGRLDRGG
jgi:hypothetical protein